MPAIGHSGDRDPRIDAYIGLQGARPSRTRAVIRAVLGAVQQPTARCLQSGMPGLAAASGGPMDISSLMGDPLFRGGIGLAAALVLIVLAAVRWGNRRDEDRPSDSGLD